MITVTNTQLLHLLVIFNGDENRTQMFKSLEEYKVARMPWFKVTPGIQPNTYNVFFELKYADIGLKLSEVITPEYEFHDRFPEWRKRYVDTFTWFTDRLPQQRLTMADVQRINAKNEGKMKRARKRDADKEALKSYANGGVLNEEFEVVSDWREDTRGLPEISHLAGRILDRIGDQDMTKQQAARELGMTYQTPVGEQGNAAFSTAWAELIARGNIAISTDGD